MFTFRRRLSKENISGEIVEKLERELNFALFVDIESILREFKRQQHLL